MYSDSKGKCFKFFVNFKIRKIIVYFFSFFSSSFLQPYSLFKLLNKNTIFIGFFFPQNLKYARLQIIWASLTACPEPLQSETKYKVRRVFLTLLKYLFLKWSFIDDFLKIKIVKFMFLTSSCKTILWCLSALLTQGGCDRRMETKTGFHHRKSVFTLFTTSSKSPLAYTQEPLRLQGFAELSQPRQPGSHCCQLKVDLGVQQLCWLEGEASESTWDSKSTVPPVFSLGWVTGAVLRCLQ